jgi:hypothetical protein
MTDRGGNCPSCGSSGTAFLEERLCPACLLRLALQDAEMDAGRDGTPGAEDRYVVRALMDDSEEITACIAEDSVSGRLVRLEVAKRQSGAPSAAFEARIDDLRRLPQPGIPRVLDGGLSADGRAWLVTDWYPAPRAERRWLLLELGLLSPAL